MATEESLSFRSPVSKLLRFFHRSRDRWKAKCKAAKRENKSLKYCLAKMTQSRDRWKAEGDRCERASRKSPTLMRLRELEILEKVATSGKLNVVLGEKGLAERVVNLL